MTKDWIRPIVWFRTPEQHRLAIQGRYKPEANSNRSKKTRKKKWREIPGFATYAEYLASPQWKEVRDRWMKSKLCKGEKCHALGCDEVYFLSLHHRTYDRIGMEQLQDLILVCKKCHHKIHMLEKSGMSLYEATKRVVG